MSIRWHFVEGYEGDATYWSWRTVSGDGTIETQSASFSTYGQAVSEAIRNGFQPRLQHWVVATRHTVTHFRPGQTPLTVPVSDAEPAPSARKGKEQAKPDGTSGDGQSAPASSRHRREPH
jgi:hypothetical protein